MDYNDITVLVTTSYLPICHPCAAMLHRVIGSLERIGLDEAPKVIVCDGNLAHPRAYERYRGIVRNTYSVRTTMVESDVPLGFGMAVVEGIKAVHTKYVFVLQHDFTIVESIPIQDILTLMSSGDVNVLRLNKRMNRVMGRDTILEGVTIAGVPVCRTPMWSDNPFFVSPDYFRETIVPKMKQMPGSGGLETHLHLAYAADIEKMGFAVASAKWKVFIYGGLGFPQVLSHTNGGNPSGTCVCGVPWLRVPDKKGRAREEDLE